MITTLGGAGGYDYRQGRVAAGKTSGMSLRDRYFFGAASDYVSDRPVHVYRDALYTTGGGRNGQELHLVYDESSTDEDPVIKAWGVDSNGKDYEELIHVNEVNPCYATTAEMKALEAHLKEQGDSVLTASMPRIPNLVGETLSGFDVHEKINFIQLFHEIADKTMEPCEADSTRIDADRFLYLWMNKKNKLIEDVAQMSHSENDYGVFDRTNEIKKEILNKFPNLTEEKLD